MAAVYLASRKSVLGLGRLIPLAATLFGAAMIALSFSHSFYLSAPIMLLLGFGMMTQMACSNTLIQTIVEDDKRGRVMSIYAMAFRGIAPFGSLLAGTLASRFGALNALLIGGVSVVVGAAFFARGLPELRRRVRPIYVREGIIPEVAEGINSADVTVIPPDNQG
jgi:MFS family permease